MMGRLPDPTICLPHNNGGNLLSVLPKGTTRKVVGLFSTTITIVLSAKQGSCKYYFFKSFGMT